jgi:predicted RNase H-like nuclease (RuvC/YqgF family)
MSWLSGSLSNFTGQLTNLTKDILSEGTVEIEDLPSELKLSHNKIKELENSLSNQKYENDRLKELCEELQLKCETDGIRLSHVHENYREILFEKEAEINDLTQQLINERNSQTKASSNNQQPTSANWQDEHITINSSHCDFASEDKDFGNVELINTIDLNNQTPTQTQLSTIEYDVNQLLKENQDLKNQLIAFDELRQSEILAIQNNYENKLAALNNSNNELLQKQKESFDQQIAEWNQKIAEVQQKVSSNATSGYFTT